MEKKVYGLSRRSYQKPVLEQVRLIAEEAVLANCKVTGYTDPDTGPGLINCGVGSIGGACSGQS